MRKRIPSRTCWGCHARFASPAGGSAPVLRACCTTRLRNSWPPLAQKCSRWSKGESGAEGPAQHLTDYLDRALARLRKEVAVLLESEIDVWEMVLRCYELTREMQARAGVLVDCRIVGSVERFQNLDANIAATAFSVVREALRNAERHAAAQHVEVSVEAKQDSLEVTVTDDGLGVGRSHEGMGLTLLRDSVE